MKHFFIILLFLSTLLILSCKKKLNKKNKNEDVVIIFEGRTFEKDTLKVNGIMASYNVNPSLTYIKEGDFQEKKIFSKNFLKIDTIILKTKKNIIINHKYHFYYNSLYYLKTGDTIIFKYKDDAPFVTINSENAQNIETQYNLKNKVLQSSMEFFLRNDHFRNENEENKYKLSLNNNLDKKINFLNNNKNRLDSKYYYYLKNKLVFEKKIINNDNDLIINDTLLVLNTYRDNIERYYNEKYSNKTVKTSNGWRIDNRAIYDSLATKKSINSLTYKYILYHNLKEIAKNFSSQDLEKYLIKFQKITNDSILINEIKSDYLLDYINLRKDIKSVHFMDINGKIISLSEVLKKNKGKLVYIDFWASWCAPCRVEIPSSKLIQKEFENKNIEFIYISIDTNKNKWLKANKDENLLPKNNYLALNYPQASFYNELKLKTIPRYILFDKNGILISDSAPKPSEKRLKNIFTELSEDKKQKIFSREE